MDDLDMKQMYQLSTRHCIVCFKVSGKMRNKTLYWHVAEPGENSRGVGIWTWCNRCERGYTIEEYTAKAGLSLSEFLKQDFHFKEVANNEVNKIDFPNTFIPLFDPRASEGVKYLKRRGIEPDDNLLYCMKRNGIAFPYYYDNIFCGAQIRLIEPWVDSDGVERKIDTIPGTRTGLLVYNYNQVNISEHIRGFIITEGAFNALSIQQALNSTYGGMMKNPFKVVALSGSGVSAHHLKLFKELKEQGLKIIAAPDSDQAGYKMADKFIKNEAATHYAFTDNTQDWNDFAKTMNKKDFARFFLDKVSK